ncbi:MAG: hypothetical protein J2P20_16490, partial [Pseudonocardia sp.]|nr:hypothetical protein [Pseudonocardia sp.]
DVHSTSPAGAHAAPAPEARATATPGAEGTTPPVTAFGTPGAPVRVPESAPVGTASAGTASVAPVNTTPGAPVHMNPGYPAATTPGAPPAPEQAPPTLNGHGRHSDAIGVPSMFAGEVPISQLAAEETATQIAVPPQLMGEVESAATTTTIAAVGPVGAPEKADVPGSSDPAAPEEPVQDGAASERPQPIVWRVPDQTVTGVVRRIRAETADAIRPRRLGEARFNSARAAAGGSKKWVWLGIAAATVVALAVGGTKLLSQQHTDAAAPVNPAPAAVDSPAGPKATVTKVLDGDTVEVAGSDVNGTVEVLGIVAPRLDKNQCGAAAAKAFATRTLENTPVTLVSDPSQPATSRTGHRLAFLKLPNGSDYSVLATQEGMTRFYDSPQAARMASDIKAAEAEAQGKHAGLWGSPCNLKPPSSGAGSTSTSGGSASPARTTG